MIKIDNELIDELLAKAKSSDRLRMNMDMRTSENDNSQRMLNALLPGTVVSVHRHLQSTESVFCLRGRMEEVIYEEVISYEESGDSRVKDVMRKVELREVERITLCPAEGKYGCSIPAGAWHTVEVYEPSVIFEAKDGRYAPMTPEEIWSEI